MKVICDHAHKPRCPWPECPHKNPHEWKKIGTSCETDMCWDHVQAKAAYANTRCVPVKEKKR